ncbi:UNVERIFIED_CONTAM: hypothetical protein Slati_1743600 [Sesamum latifolium]|uniref:Uncharacterized protein n=1 Tax=Sesamum latifolium TaxID=2727402 RepID=A0AAW2WW85_9LAMI
MESPANTPSKKKSMEVPGKTQALQVVSETSLAPTSGTQAPIPPRPVDLVADPPRRSTFSWIPPQENCSQSSRGPSSNDHYGHP